MDRIYKILDYQNKKIYGEYLKPEDVCIVLDIVSSHSNSFEVITTNGEFVMGDFVCTNNIWQHIPLKKDNPRHLALLQKALYLVEDARRIISKGQITTNSDADYFIDECREFLKSYGVNV